MPILCSSLRHIWFFYKHRDHLLQRPDPLLHPVLWILAFLLLTLLQPKHRGDVSSQEPTGYARKRMVYLRLHVHLRLEELYW